MVKSRNFDLIVFDWDGTLFDSTALIVRAMQKACLDLNLPAPDDKKASYVIGLGLHDALHLAVPELPVKQYPDLVQRYRRHYLESQHELCLFDGVLNMLNDLKGHQHVLAVATGKSRRGLDEALAHAELNGMFDATRTADETVSKPHPQMLMELMEVLDILPERTLMVGDTTHDMLLARNAGVQSVAVAYGAHDREALSVQSPLFVAQSAHLLHDWLVNNA